MSMQAPVLDAGERVLPRPARRLRRGARASLAVMVALGVALPIVAGVVTHPVRSVRIGGEFVAVSKADIERAVQPMLDRSLIGIDLGELRRVALEVPGVRQAKVRRVWPDSLEIWVVERVPVARWAGGGYLEIDGTLFDTAVEGGPGEALPVLAGPEGFERRVLGLHSALERALEPLGLALVATELSRRGVLYATLRDGPRLVMRPESVPHPAGTYASILATLMTGRLNEVDRVDFRYPTGFAVRMRTGDADSEAKG